MQLLQIGVATQFLCRNRIYVLVIVVIMFLVLLEFLSRPRKSIATEFCRHLIEFLVATSF